MQGIRVAYGDLHQQAAGVLIATLSCLRWSQSPGSFSSSAFVPSIRISDSFLPRNVDWQSCCICLAGLSFLESFTLSTPKKRAPFQSLWISLTVCVLNCTFQMHATELCEGIRMKQETPHTLDALCSQLACLSMQCEDCIDNALDAMQVCALLHWGCRALGRIKCFHLLSCCCSVHSSSR